MRSNRVLIEPILALFFFLIVLYWVLGAHLLDGEIVAPMDLLLQYRGWQESGLSLPLFNPERSDIIDWLLPRWIFMKDAILAGHLALWNPLLAGGEPAFPLLSNSYISLRFLLFLLFDNGLGFTLGLLAQLAMAGLGTYLLCRSRLDIVSSLFGGVTYMLCGFNVSWMMWPHVSTSVWIPWVLWALICVVDSFSQRRVAVLAIMVATLVFGGFPSVAAYGLYTVALLFTWLIMTRSLIDQPARDHFHLSLWVSGGLVLGLLLTGLQLIPFAEYLTQLDLSYRSHGGLSLHLITLLWDPFQNGQPRVEVTGYAGRIALFLATMALLLSTLPKQHRWGPLSPYFWTSLTLLTLVAVYQTPFFLAQYLYKLPVLNFNTSNRLMVLFGLEIAVLSAVGLQGLQRAAKWLAERSGSLARVSPVVAGVLGGVLILGQIIDISRVSRAQNAVVPKETFLPETPAIRYVKERIQPGQNVLGTSDAYMIPGSLGSYGLSEWFAISFLTGREKKSFAHVVEDAWVGPTAAVFSYRQIKLASFWMDVLGIRYVMTANLHFVGQESNDHPSPPMPTHVLGQTLQLDQPTIVHGIDLLLATYGRSSAGSDVWLRYFDKNNQLLAETQVAGTTIRDNSWVTFHFSTPLKLPVGIYRFELGLRDPHPDQPVTVWAWLSSDRFQNGYRTVDSEQAAGDLSFRLIGYSQNLLEGWKFTTPGNSVIVLERQESPPGAYLLKLDSLQEEPEPKNMSWGNIELAAHSSDYQIFRVWSEKPGWLVRTARHWKGWEAYVNGQPSEIKTYLDFLPVVKLGAGVSMVEWRYNPMSWKIGLGISFGALLLILLLVLSPRLHHIRSVCER